MAIRFPLPFRTSISFYLGQFVNDHGFQSDAALLIGTPQDQIASLTQELTGSAFVDREVLLAACKRHIKDHPVNVARLLWQINELISESIESRDSILEPLSKTIGEKFNFVDDEKSQVLIDRIDQCILRIHGFRIQEKAEDLAEATGYRVDGFTFVSDLRPVFDQGRECAVGWIPLTTLSIESEHLPFDAHLELNLTEPQLDSLLEKIKEAKDKLTYLKTVVKEQDWAIPNTNATSED